MITKEMLQLAMIGALQLHGKKIYKEVLGYGPRVNYDTTDEQYTAIYRSGQFPPIKFEFSLTDAGNFWQLEFKTYKDEQATLHIAEVVVPFSFEASAYTEDKVLSSLRDAFRHVKEKLDQRHEEAA